MATIFGLLCLSYGLVAGEPATPFLPVPSARQLAWHATEFYGLIHFGLNTFTNEEWGNGEVNPSVFNPTEFDADKVVSIMASAGMRGIILVCKHHDGFCLWPSKFTEYSVKASPWRNGHGDMVKEFSDACRKRGLKFGVYLSPWDRNHAEYGHAPYLPYYRAQLKELLEGYGEVFMAWFDGANGGSGYYGGAREVRHIDRSQYYAWPETWKLVRELQPNATIFSDVGPDVRWVGNEQGIASEPCWNGFESQGLYPGGPVLPHLRRGKRGGTEWVPAECDVSIRPGWFYHAREDRLVKSAWALVDTYYNSVGRGACLDLNVPLDTRGRIADRDAAVLAKMGRILSATFTNNFAIHSIATAHVGSDADPAIRQAALTDGNPATFWLAPEGRTTADLVIEMEKPVTLDVVEIREFLPLGQRIGAFAIDAWQDQSWKELTSGKSIGNRRLARVARTETQKVRLRITEAAAPPAISELGLYLTPSPAVIR